jgi:hypothetical protein
MGKTITATAAIITAEETTAALAEYWARLSTDWGRAYAAVRWDRANGFTADAIAKALPAGSGCKTAATITDMERAGAIDCKAAWVALWALPVRKNGKRITTLHGLIAKARKEYGRGAASVLDEMIATATTKARVIVEKASESGDQERGQERASATYAALVKALDALTAPVTDEAPTGEDEVPTGNTVAPDNVQTGMDEDEPPSLDARVLRLAGEANALRTVLVAGGGMVTRDALTALLRATGELSRDVADILGATPVTAAK